MNTLYERAVSYKKQGEFYLDNGDYEQAKYYLKKALNELLLLRSRSEPLLRRIWDKAINDINMLLMRIEKRSKADQDYLYDLPSNDKKRVKFGKNFKFIFDALKNAQSIVRIATPWFSANILQKIANIALENEVPIYILVSPVTDAFKKRQIEAYSYLKDLQETYPDMINARAVANLHAKLIIIDEKLLIVGSANLTNSGMFKNVEFVSVDESPQAIHSAINEFDNMWYNNSRPL